MLTGCSKAFSQGMSACPAGRPATFAYPSVGAWQPGRRPLPRLLCLFLLWMVTVPASAAGCLDQGCRGLFDRFPESRLVESHAQAFAAYGVITSVGRDMQVASQPFEGRATDLIYRAPVDATLAEVYTTYRRTIRESDLQIMVDCNPDACPDGLFLRWARLSDRIGQWEDVDPRAIERRRDYRLLTAADENGRAVTVVIARVPGEDAVFVLVSLIEPAPAESANLSVAEAVARGLHAAGRAEIPGLRFEIETAQGADSGPERIRVAPGSEYAVRELAMYLGTEAGDRFLITGHHARGYMADGRFCRAETVARRLHDHGVDRDRIRTLCLPPLPDDSVGLHSVRERNDADRVELISIAR